MDVFPFTPQGLPPWAWIGVIVGIVVAVPALLGGIGIYIWEAITGIPGAAPEVILSAEDEATYIR